MKWSCINLFLKKIDEIYNVAPEYRKVAGRLGQIIKRLLSSQFEYTPFELIYHKTRGKDGLDDTTVQLLSAIEETLYQTSEVILFV